MSNSQTSFAHSDDRTPELSQLTFRKVAAFYGDAQVLNDVSLSVKPGEIVALLGSNGAGKTTLLRTLTGLLRLRRGRIILDNESIDRLPAYKIIRRGVASVPEGRQLFGTLSVADNLLLGTYPLKKRERKRMRTERLAMVLQLFPILKERRRQQSQTLSGGEQQMLALGRALMSNPKVLALDEPSLGLSPILVREMIKLLKEICQELGVSILLVEQNARAALKIADYVYILERGEVTLEGSAQEVASSPNIQAAYLGG
ncbi:MAG TPA: ABC transporter ATP-binding protein [Thermodesulfobacteriota bacterium]|nr:ABC transporter ATP-binding protein [Thermodesulfobacteriota bacterium]